MKKIVIIGGGITGLSVAWKLSEKGYKVKIIEMDKFIGGLARSIKMGNYFLDIGPHSFFSEDKEVFKKVMDLFEGEQGEIPYSKRSVKMMFKGKYVDYPLSICKKHSSSNGNFIYNYVFSEFCEILYYYIYIFFIRKKNTR